MLGAGFTLKRLGKTQSIYILFLALSLGASIGAFAHKGHGHGQAPAESPIGSGAEKAAFTKINTDYLNRVKPIFQKSCFDCHSDQTRYPWYHQVLGIKQLLDRDISEAKKHMDMSGDFPFQGHGTPPEDLEAIADVVSKGSMPPFRYRLMHPGSKLSESERSVVLEWVKESRAEIEGLRP